MSSDGIGAVGESADAVTDTAAAGSGSADPAAAVDEAQSADPWFAAGPKAAANGDPTGGSAETQAEWFLRTGRAGLLPDSIIRDDDGTSAPDRGHDFRVEAAGAPPWAAEAADVSATAPPPWETGPWPGPGGGTAGSGAVRRGGSGELETRATSIPGSDSVVGTDSVAAAAGDGRWSARTVLIAGLLPFVVPGLVAGILGLRQRGTSSVRKASLVAIGASVAWAVIIVLIVAGGSGGSGGACTGYPVAVHQAYHKAMTDLRDHASASVQAVDLGTAASMANASAAAAGQIGVRTALFAMADDMAQARADVVAGLPVPGTLRTHLNDDGAAPAGSCTS